MRAEPGTVLDGKFRILRKLGEGGMGVVVAADQLQLRAQVAIKLLKREASPERLEGPANLFLASTRDGRQFIKVLDFGISKVNEAARSEGPALTDTGAMLGSLHVAGAAAIDAPGGSPRRHLVARRHPLSALKRLGKANAKAYSVSLHRVSQGVVWAVALKTGESARYDLAGAPVK